MAKVFRGQVKIQDVKDELERIVDEVNTLIDNYNDALAGIHSNIFSEGAASLAAPGYTLSIGGLKTLMNAYRGCAVGSKVFKINDTTAVVTKGVYFSEDGESAIHMPQGTVTINASTKSIYMDTTNGTYSTTSGTNKVLIAKVNSKRGSKMISTYPFDAEGVSGLKIRSGNNNKDPKEMQTPNNSKKGCFIRAWQPELDQGASDGKFWEDRMYLDGKQVGYTKTRGYRQFNYFVWAPLMYLPKGIGNPFTHRSYYEGELRSQGAVSAAPCEATITRDEDN